MGKLASKIGAAGSGQAAKSPGAAGGGGTGQECDTKRPLHKATIAKAILFEEPDISPTELAKRVGVSRGTLYSKSKKWIDVRRTLKARDNTATPHGTKSADGKLDAAADDRESHPTHDQ